MSQFAQGRCYPCCSHTSHHVLTVQACLSCADMARRTPTCLPTMFTCQPHPTSDVNMPTCSSELPSFPMLMHVPSRAHVRRVHSTLRNLTSYTNMCADSKRMLRASNPTWPRRRPHHMRARTMCMSLCSHIHLNACIIFSVAQRHTRNSYSNSTQSVETPRTQQLNAAHQFAATRHPIASSHRAYPQAASVRASLFFAARSRPVDATARCTLDW